MACQILSGILRQPAQAITSSVFLRCAGAKTSASSRSAPLPERPKKPPTGYINFIKDTLPKVFAEMPDGKRSGKEALSRASQLWKELPGAERQKYNDRFVTEREKYRTELAAFEAALTPVARGQLMQAEREKKMARAEAVQKRAKKHEMSEMGRPKRPTTPFMMFLLDDKKKNPDRRGLRLIEYTTDLGKKWAALSEQDKAPYQHKYVNIKAQYEDELERWERKMISLGRQDLVREKVRPLILETPKTKNPSQR